MAEQDDLVTKVDDLAKHIGEAVSAKLSKADASESYAAKSSLKSLAYKDKVEAADISDSVLENLTGPQGPQGFGYYGGYVYKNLTLDEWKELGVLGSTHTYEVGDTSNIRIGDFGLVVGAVTDLTTTQALVNFKVTGITSNSISTVSLGFIVGEPGNADSIDLSDLVTKEELDEFDSDVVHKTGDTMTGILHVTTPDTQLRLIDPNWAMGQVPASGEQARRIALCGNEGELSAVLQDIMYADGHKGFLMTHRLNSSSPWKSIILGINPDGYTWMHTDALRINFGNGTGFWIE